MMKRYVLGFAFNEKRDRVLLINKRRPDWQAGKMNGIGGMVEADESVVAAMVREFAEETGIATMTWQWEWFGRIFGDDAEVHLFRAFGVDIELWKPLTDERPTVRHVNGDSIHTEALPNVAGLIRVALDPQEPIVTLDYRITLRKGGE